MQLKISFYSLNNMLESYNERDKILRLLCYASQLVSGLVTSDKLITLNSLISECRTTARLFDDIPMLMYTVSYGLGKKEPDIFMQVCGVLVNVLDQLYYPCEHIAWASDKGLLSVRSESWWLASNICWLLSLYFSIARSLRYLHLLHIHSKHLDLSEPTMREEYKKNSSLQLDEILCGIRCVCDMIHAIHWMPEGFLWAGKLKTWHIGALGTVSTLLSLAQTCATKDTTS